MSRQTKLIRVAVGIIQRQDKVLLAKRPPDKPYSGYWEFPGGKIELDESGEQALYRELHEELGIDVITAKHCFDHRHDYPDKSVMLELWHVTELTGEPHGKEDQELRWLLLKEIDQLNLLEGNWPILEKIKQLF